MQHTALWCFRSIHSYLPSIVIHMLEASSFLFPYSCCAGAVVSVSTIEKECHQSLPTCFLSVCTVLCYVPLLSCTASPVLWFCDDAYFPHETEVEKFF